MRWGWGVLAALWAGPALGQADTGQEQIVVTATRVPSQVAEIPAGVTVIDRVTIEARGYTTLVDALSAVPGLRVAQSGGPGSQASVFVRGTESRHVLVLLDGVPINDPGDPNQAFNFGVDTLADVERIEVVRGPMSSLYGSGAIGGVINIITRRGQAALHGSVTAAGGLPRQGLLQGDIAGRSGIWDYAASAEGQSLLGFDQTPKRESGVYSGERDGDRNKQAEITLGVTPWQDTRISLLLRARDAKYGYDEQGTDPANFLLTTFDGGNATGYDASLFGRLGVTSKLLDGAWDTSLYLSRLRDDRRYTVTFDPADPTGDVADDRYHGWRNDVAWNNVVALPDWGAARETRLTFGYEHSNDNADSKVDENSYLGPFTSLVRAHADTDSGYAGLETRLWGRLLTTAQLREDATTIAGDAFTWRLGATLALPEVSARLHAAYGTGFRAPALFDRYGIEAFFMGNPNLKPEFSRGWEFGGAADLALGQAGVATLSLTYFDNRIRDLITFAFGSTSSTLVNVGAARAHGVEATLDWRWADWVSVDAAYTYTDSRDLDSGARLLRRPYNQASLDLRLSPVRGVTVAPEVLYVGSFVDYLTNDQGFQGIAPGLSPSGWLVNVNASWQATRRVSLFVWAKNIGGSRFEPVNGYQTPGASFLAGARVGF